MDDPTGWRQNSVMENYKLENLTHDPVHGYIRFVAPATKNARDAETLQTELPGGDASKAGGERFCERDLIDHPWVQRMRQIRQLQTAWWVFPSAEHSRFQHILGVMHLASRACDHLYESLKEVEPDCPSKPVLESLLRIAGLLHDVGHGPFGHFFDAHFLQHFGLTHESLGALIIKEELAGLIQGIQRAPTGGFDSGERLDASQIAWLIQRPQQSGLSEESSRPRWMHLLRSLFCGIYTIDNMDFVLRDAFMTGLNPRAFDLQRVLHYSRFTAQGLTIHERGMPALIHFLGMKAELFRNVYFHRTVRAIDLELAVLFRESRECLFPGDPRDHLDAYRELTEFSLLTDVRRWHRSNDPKYRQLGNRWLDWLNRKVPWIMVCQRNISFVEGQAESSSIFGSRDVLAMCIKDRLPSQHKQIPFEVDLARHIHRPHTAGATAGLNFYYDTASQKTHPLTMHGLYQRLPISHTIVRIYAKDTEHRSMFSEILDGLIGTTPTDDLTNM